MDQPVKYLLLTDNISLKEDLNLGPEWDVMPLTSALTGGHWDRIVVIAQFTNYS
ncbi:hypothetical protein UFOVP826_1, partial [uncultured Caudovirales phage]